MYVSKLRLVVLALAFAVTFGGIGAGVATATQPTCLARAHISTMHSAISVGATTKPAIASTRSTSSNRRSIRSTSASRPERSS